MQQYQSPEVELLLFSAGELMLASGEGTGGTTGGGETEGVILPVFPSLPSQPSNPGDDDDDPGRPLPVDPFD